MKVIDIDKKPENEKIFFGDFGHYLRIDSVSHEVARKLKEASEGNTWFSKEVDYKSDKTRFSSLPQDAQRAFKLNIAYYIRIFINIKQNSYKLNMVYFICKNSYRGKYTC